ncbi:MAG: DUF421 domain-containing protein [Syntrophomonadaceae bacterium]|nr:DUF421 domain-containing protein [Syntrophomonadaceae bacterium]
MDVYLGALFKTVIAFLGILVYTRILGKRHMSQLTFYDYIAGITLGVIAAMIAITPGEDFWILIWVLTIFTILSYVINLLTLKSRPMRKLIAGEPVILIHNGKIMEHNLGKTRYNIEDVLMQLREKDVFNIADVEFAIAETDGQLTVMKKSQKRPVTAADLGIDTPYEGIPAEIIIDGKVIYQNLKQNNLDETWLMNQLKGLGYSDPREITYASLDVNGNLYIDERQDKLENMSDISD